MSDTSVVIPNWNGKKTLGECLESLKKQSHDHQAFVVDNGSTDGSVDFIESNHHEVRVIKHEKNLGFAGGVNSGIKMAMATSSKYIALLNNDAQAEQDWLKHLVGFMGKNPRTGIAAAKIVSSDKKRLDSTGEQYSVWGMPYPRGRGETDLDKYDHDTEIFGASGGASIYRVKMLEEIGLFDEDFFAYYEDVDISFRAQLAGWKVNFVPKAVVYHEIGATSGKIHGFTTYHTLKNLPLLFWKNVPHGIKFKIWIRLVVLWLSIAASAILRGQVWPFLKACFVGSILWPKKLVERRRIQQNRKVSTEYINSIIFHDLPPNAYKLRRLRRVWWKLTFRSGA